MAKKQVVLLKELHYASDYGDIKIDEDIEGFAYLLKFAADPDSTSQKDAPYANLTMNLSNKIHHDAVIFVFKRCMAGLVADIRAFLDGSKPIEGVSPPDEIKGEGLDEPCRKVKEALEALAADAESYASEAVLHLSKYNVFVGKFERLKLSLRCLKQVDRNLAEIEAIENLLRDSEIYLKGMKICDEVKEAVKKEKGAIREFTYKFPQSAEALHSEDARKAFNEDLRAHDKRYESLTVLRSKLKAEYDNAKSDDARRIEVAFDRIRHLVPDTKDCEVILDGRTGEKIAGSMKDLAQCAVLTTKFVQDALLNPKAKKATLSLAWFKENNLVSDDAQGIIIVHDGYDVEKLTKPVLKSMDPEHLYFSAQAYQVLGLVRE